VIEERRWCYEYIPPEGNRLEMLRIVNEPARGVSIGATFYYVVDFDLDGLVDVGSTTETEAADQQRRLPIANVVRFFSSQHEARRTDTARMPEDI
jgi:hypothetical protein